MHFDAIYNLFFWWNKPQTHPGVSVPQYLLVCDKTHWNVLTFRPKSVWFAYLLSWLHFSRFYVETSKIGLFEIVSFIKLWVLGVGGVRRMNWTIYGVRVGGMIDSYKILYENPKGKRPLRRSGRRCKGNAKMDVNPLNPELNPICYLLALLAHHFLHVSRIRVKSLTLKWLMSYIYIWH